ncbi:MAG TPA: bifunctional serine/threonine-protein kinase/universal stress protein [Burkholderiaceae bacterium]|nr:bifunctional serine/threonine-protein kinase/universal stress protein [Burkholderiaceae bacterium]
MAPEEAVQASSGGAAPAGAGVLVAGRVIDGFRLEERVHQGGMANLWRVSHPQHDPPLLMKVPRLRPGEDPATIVGFEVEQMILPMLQGPHVPRFFARGDFTHQPYIVMERIDGPSLGPRADDAPLALDEVTELGARIAAAIHDVHRQHVVHLDIKPENVLLRPDGTAVLVDFGLSRHDALPDLLAEEFRQPMGSWPYIAPEQVQFVRNEPRSDLFALGVMLYQFTTGELPFGEPRSMRALRRRLHVAPAPPRALRADCPPWLQEVILRCLEVEPARRWPTAAQLALALEDPRQLPLPERARHSVAESVLARLRRRYFQVAAPSAEPPPRSARAQVVRCPIIVAAVDLSETQADLAAQVREMVRRIVVTDSAARLACVSVLKTGLLSLDDYEDESGANRHVKHLAALKHWARPISKLLNLDDGRLTFHVLESTDPAAALIDFAQRNGVDQIVMGARAHGAVRRYLGSVSSQVVAQAPCTVTVVRA